jgi:hypothetical protein
VKNTDKLQKEDWMHGVSWFDFDEDGIMLVVFLH